jgi:hypothetical protein
MSEDIQQLIDEELQSWPWSRQHTEATPKAPQSLSVEHLALDIWIRARSGLTPLDSERAVRALILALNEIRDDFLLRIDECELRATTAAGQASTYKGLVKRLLQLVRGGYERCPVCDVGDTQRHTEECWLRQLGSPVWTRQTTIDRRLAQAHSERKKKGPRKGRGRPRTATTVA